MSSAERRWRRPLAAACLAGTLAGGLAGCGSGGGATAAAAVVPPVGTAAGHTLGVTVNGARCSAGAYVNKPCVRVTVCAPGTTTCQAVDDVLLDTGSYGLRIFRQALPLALPAVTVPAGPLATCVQFADGASDWGPVVQASVQLGDAAPVTTPIQVIDAGYGTVPAACPSPEGSPAAAGLNGVLGVGPFLQDCGAACERSAANGLYFACGATGCTGAAVPLASQLQNPAALLPGLSNGLVVDLPAVGAGGAASADGVVLFGIDASADTTPAGVTVYPLDGSGNLVDQVAGVVGRGFLDTGSNGLFFAPPAGSGLTACTGAGAGWLCPATTVSLSAAFRTGAGALGPATSFQVANFDQLVGTGHAVFPDLGGGAVAGLGFDWGLPFHLGRKVYLGFEGRSSSLGAGPYVAF